MKPLRTIRSVRRLEGGKVDALVCDEHLRLVHVVVPYGNSDETTLCEIIDAALDARRPGLPKQGASNG